MCFVLAGLAAFLQKLPHFSGVLLLGFGLITLSFTRQAMHYIGYLAELFRVEPRRKRRAVHYPRALSVVFWGSVSWACFRYAFIDFNITEQWLRWVFRY